MPCYVIQLPDYLEMGLRNKISQKVLTTHRLLNYALTVSLWKYIASLFTQIICVKSQTFPHYTRSQLLHFHEFSSSQILHFL